MQILEGVSTLRTKLLENNSIKTAQKTPTFPRLVLNGQMIKSARNKLCTFAHKRGRVMTDRD